MDSLIKTFVIITSIILLQSITACTSQPLKGEAQYKQLMGKTFSIEKLMQIEQDAINGDKEAIDAMCFSNTKDNVTFSDGSSFCTEDNLPNFNPPIENPDPKQQD